MDPERRRQVAIDLGVNRVLAHQVLFGHRHPDVTPLFHSKMILDWNGPSLRVLLLAFRGGAKSTISEEAMIIGAIYREFKNALIIGATGPLAVERLKSIKHEFETNEKIAELYGDLRGTTWTDDEIVLSTGVRFIARGRGQKMRGTKYLDQRPDACFIDDVEDSDDTPTTTKATKAWFRRVLLPALDPQARLRMSGNVVRTDCLAETLAHNPEWVTHRYPVKYRDKDGHWQALWPQRFPLKAIDAIEANFRLDGDMRGFNMEYMCLAENAEDMVFTRDMFRVVPQLRTWQPVWCMFDPARTTHVATSARTGFAAWSWIGRKLVIWEAWGRFLKPSEIIDAVFEANARFTPVHLGVEEDGLNEWLLQPLRTEMAARGIVLPLRPMRAPKGKLDFIRALQPYYNARDVEHAARFEDLEDELINLGQGKVDVPNALAYAQLMRKGRPIYGDFSARHVEEGLLVNRDQPMWLALNSSRAVTAGALVQIVDGAVRVLADYAREGDPSETAPWVVEEAKRGCRGLPVRLVSPPLHWDQYNNVGLRPAIRPNEAEKGSDPSNLSLGREAVRDLLQREMRGLPALLVDSTCRWTTAALGGGYAQQEAKGGVITGHAQEGLYRVLMEAIESLVGMSRTRSTREAEHVMNAVTPGGQPYRSMLGQAPRTLRRG